MRKVRSKLPTMLDTPTFTASASSSAISASDRPESCCRASAKNHCESGPRAAFSPNRNSAAIAEGSSKAAPSSSAPSTANAASNESPSQKHAKPPAAITSASELCPVNHRRCASRHATGKAVASKGSRAALSKLDADATSAPITLMAMPRNHQRGASDNSPGI